MSPTWFQHRCANGASNDGQDGAQDKLEKDRPRIKSCFLQLANITICDLPLFVAAYNALEFFHGFHAFVNSSHKGLIFEANNLFIMQRISSGNAYEKWCGNNHDKVEQSLNNKCQWVGAMGHDK